MELDVERRVELWIGAGVGLIFFTGNAGAAWWLLEWLHRGKSQLMGVPILALGLSLAEGFVFRKLSDRAASAFVGAGFIACLLAFALLNGLQGSN